MNINEFEKHLTNVKHQGNERIAACPVCEKGDPKGKHLYYRKEEGRLLLDCKHGCSFEEIMATIPLEVKTSQEEWKLLRSHMYHDERGLVLAKKSIFQVGGSKQAVWHRKEGTGFVKGLEGLKAPLYNLNGVVNADLSETIYIVEGEKDVDTLTSLGYAATSSPHGARWSKDYIQVFKDREVIIIPDNDEPGRAYGDETVKSLRGIAASVGLLDISRHIEGFAAKGDVSDVLEKYGEERLRELLKRVVWEEDFTGEEQPPRWLIREEGSDGKPRLYLNESIFVSEFKQMNSLACINGVFYNLKGPLPENRIVNMIHLEITRYFNKNLAAKERSLLVALKAEAYQEFGEPDPSLICCANATLKVQKGSALLVKGPAFAMNKLAVDYIADAPVPKSWINFLAELLYEEDIPCLQEYLGYCLIPTTIAQKCLNITGRGGEGKSRIGVACNAIFGSTMISEKIGKIAEDRFLIPQLDGKNLFYDDDLDTKKLTDTGLFKNLVTNELLLQGERKGVDKFPVRSYARFLACGNSQLASCFDKTDGFYRRMLIMKCKPKVRGEGKDDPYLGSKLIEEKEGIFLWMIEGLQRLIDNDFKFSVSERMRENLNQAKEDDTNIISFLRDPEYLVYNEGAKIPSKDLLSLYKQWCEMNAEVPLADRTFLEYMKSNQEQLGIAYMDQIRLPNGSRVRGYTGLSKAKTGR